MLSGFNPDTKVSISQSMQENVEILVVVNVNRIEKNKVHGDLGFSMKTNTFA